ncbi:MAG: heavy metal translocating P-type ATPase [Candidatus Peregrinibacteria bacterium]|nr:heavy metal translocating P-type ATPase [Candidatus Peregrinibacteria bacterium]
MKKKISLRSFPVEYAIGIASLISIIAWVILRTQGMEDLAMEIFRVLLIIGSIPVFIEIIGAIRKGQFGADIIALLAIITSYVMNQYLAGIFIVLMLSGGRALENFALSRAKKELTSLISNAPRKAHKKEKGELRSIPVDEVGIGDIIVVKPGEVVAVDGIVTEGNSPMDESALTGESIPVEKGLNSHVMSGSINKGNVLEIKAIHVSKDSQYEQIIRLVEGAEKTKAPMVRLADRYSGWFTIITLILSGTAWALAHEGMRLLAVLVVATPCPLILATPIAIVSGMSKAAKKGIIIKNGGALEALGNTKTFVFDKTGTLTFGVPNITEIKAEKGTPEEIIQIAASLDQVSVHVIARSLIQYAKTNNIALSYPTEFEEIIGSGAKGKLDHTTYYLGKLGLIESQGINIPKDVKEHEINLKSHGKMALYLASEKEFLGTIYLADTVRPEVKTLFESLHRHGIRRTVMLTGDRKAVANHIGEQAGVHEVIAECLPDDKLKHIERLRKESSPVVMVGDGINDAPALAAADIGIAMGSTGSTATSEVADIVIMVDNIERVSDAFAIARRTLKIAKQSIFTGMGLSVFFMIIAAFGYIPPLYGAIIQEAVDIVVILNALRVHTD